MKTIHLLTIWLALLAASTSCKTSKNINIDPSVLTSGKWQLDYVSGVKADAASYVKGLPLMNFTTEGKLWGTTGCNSFNGDYTLSESKISLNPGAMSKMMCPGSSERDFITGMKNAASAKINDNVLTISDSAGEEIFKFIKVQVEK